MFITLKASGAGRAAPIMEQVASRNASNGEDASQPLSRLSRRPACASCQKRKLRCTGRMRDCDRCRARAIPCISSADQQAKRSKLAHLPDSQESQRHQARTTSSVESGQDDLQTNSHFDSASHQRATDQEARNKFNNLFRGDFIDFSLYEDTSNVSSTGVPSLSGNELFMGFIDVMEQDALSTSTQPQDAPLSGLATPSISTPATGLMTTQISEATLSDPAPSTKKSHGSTPTNDPSPTCSCIQDTLRVVQRLDDDDFKLTALAFDQVVQLQKWIMSQCCKPLDCVNCRTQSTALTIILIICDRLTEMFECIHKRLLRATYRVHEHEIELSHGSQHPSSTTTPETPSGADVDSGQLYCTFTGGVAGNANCNPDLFSAEFRNLYSDEEQVHMIQALTRLQIRNFRGLLMRADGASQGSGGVARRLKIEAMTARVTKAAGNIEAVW